MTLRRWRRIALRVLALMGGLLAGLLLAEYATQLFAPQDLSGSWLVPSPPRGYYLNKAGYTSRHALGERFVQYRFNRHHLRGPEIGQGQRRTLCLGDPMTFGWRLEEQDTLVLRLERGLPLWVLTAGFERIHGLDTPQGSTGGFVATAAAFFETEWIHIFESAEERVGGDRDQHVVPADLHPDEEGTRVIAESAWPGVQERLVQSGRALR